MALIRAGALLVMALSLSVPEAQAQAQRRERPEQAEARARAERDYERWVTRELTTFRSESEFRRYLTDLNAYRRTRYGSFGARGIQFAQAQPQPGQQSDTPQPVCTNPEDCPEIEAGIDSAESVVVTGTRAASNPSITNNQEAGVEEGDIVKQIGQYLLVLQDGRIFSIDTRGGATGRQLVLADRANVYRSSAAGTWYDEMLVTGNRILVTGYSYDEGDTELAVFRMDPQGRLSSEGVFTIRSYDYYDTDNYATRMVGDRLVVYTPIDPSELDAEGRLEWPLIRRWKPGHDPDSEEGRQLIDVRDIYRPLRASSEAVIHAVSVCPLGPVRPGRDLRCETRGFIGPGDREFYVSDEDVYLWVTDQEGGEGQQPCSTNQPRPISETYPAVLYWVPLAAEEEPGVAGVRGDPINQFSLQTSGGRFRALVRTPSVRCEYDGGRPLSYVTLPLSRFSAQLSEVPERAYSAMPAVDGWRVENRFTDTHLVYGGRNGWGYPPEEALTSPSPVFALPIDRPGEVRRLAVRHNILRVERAGDDIVLTGYQDDKGLDLSLVDLRATPRIASTTRLEGRFESEGRSHAFNSLIGEDRSGLMGIPTVERRREAGRWWWRSRASDISYLSVDADGRLASLGALENDPSARWHDDDAEGQNGYADEDAFPNGYSCEVSCIDWYGNSRPIFTDGRVFGLTGTELIEGRVSSGRIQEVQRLDITSRPAR